MMKRILFVPLVLAVILAACAPAPVSTPVPGSGISQAVMTVDMYYTFINIAGTLEDYLPSWNMLSQTVQCSPADRCDIQNFYERWSQVQVYYRLYDCGPTLVTAEEFLYPRGSTPADLPTDSKFWAYELVDNNGILKINDARPKKPADGCSLALERLR
jgi:hypothetical protein